MKQIEDAPKELHDLFEKELAKWPMPPDRQTEYSFRLAVQHFFFLGFNIAMATGGLRPRKRIAEIMQTDDKLIAISNERKAYVWNENDMKWEPMPDLPQD